MSIFCLAKHFFPPAFETFIACDLSFNASDFIFFHRIHQKAAKASLRRINSFMYQNGKAAQTPHSSAWPNLSVRSYWGASVALTTQQVLTEGRL